MKNPLLAALVVLQAITLVLVAGLLLRMNQPAEENDQLNILAAQVSGATHQQRQVTLYLDQLRGKLDRLLDSDSLESRRPDAATSEEPSPESTDEPAQDDGAAAAKTSRSTRTFPEAWDALQKLKTAHTTRRREIEADNAFLQPLDTAVANARTAFIRYGPEALHWLNDEANLEVFEEGRDAEFIEYLLVDVLPELSSIDPEASLNLARTALVKVTNENRVRLAGAATLRKIDSERWVKEFGDVITRGGGRTRDVSLRVSLLDYFKQDPRPEAVGICRLFLDDPAHPMPLRIQAVNVLARQDSDLVEPALRLALFEDHAPDLRMHALDGMHHRLGDGDEMRALLQDVLDTDPARMQASVREKAQKLMESLQKAG